MCQSSVHFQLGYLRFFASFSSLYTLGINHLPGNMVCIDFPHSTGPLYTVLSFAGQLFGLIQSHLCFCFCCQCFQCQILETIAKTNFIKLFSCFPLGMLKFQVLNL